MTTVEMAKKEISTAYDGVSSLRVSGDAAEAVVDVRRALRRAYEMLNREETRTDANDNSAAERAHSAGAAGRE